MSEVKSQAESGADERKYVSYWKLLKDYVKEFETANKCSFDNGAWDRIKQLEKDIIASAWIERSEAVALERETVEELRTRLAAAESALTEARQREQVLVSMTQQERQENTCLYAIIDDALSEYDANEPDSMDAVILILNTASDAENVKARLDISDAEVEESKAFIREQVTKALAQAALSEAEGG